MVSKRQIVEVAVSLANTVVYVYYALATISWFTGIDIMKVITFPPIEKLEEIFRQYSHVFNALNLGLLAVITIDQVAVGMVFRERGMPPPKYIFASSATIFSLSLILFLFMRHTPLWYFYLYFLVVSALAMVHSASILSGRMREILPKQTQALSNDLYGGLDMLGVEDIYPEPYERRVLRTCRH